MPLLEFKNVSKSFFAEGKNIEAIRNVTFSVKEDEFCCLVGPSGCGKSTLLRMVAGIDRPTEGEILFHGEPISQPNPKISMIFQTFALFPWKTVLENVEIGLDARGFPKDPRKRRELSLKYIELVGLEGFEKSYPRELSGGMRQRVGIARALVVEPEVLLMDEPFSSLDAMTAETLRKEVLRLWEDPNLPIKTCLMVTHNVLEAVYMADRVIVMSPRPGTVIDDLKIDIPRPRNLKDPAFFEVHDKIISLISKYTFHPLE
ncbi:MAG: ABC transporter ATP-binding protein [Candidatus Bathyarchaeia archaeon]